jgi:hypothetical protein
VQAVALGDRLQRVLEGDRVIGGLQGVGVAEVDLVLAARHLVVGLLDGDPHLASARTISLRTSEARSVETSK